MNSGASEPQRILVVGGTGLIGGTAALHLSALGYEVAIAARRAPIAPALAALPFVRGSYLTDEIDDTVLTDFDTIVFAAANDGRQLPAGADQRDYFYHANTQGVPAFLACARDSGIRRAVYVGSFYPSVLPAAMIEANGYLLSRRDTQQAVLALATPDFAICSLEAPHVIGHIDGLSVPVIEMVIRYLRGDIDGMASRFAVPGASNYVSARSFAEAIAGAIERGASGRSYLIGDENLSFADYYDAIGRALGLPYRIEARTEPHPLIPAGSLAALRDIEIAYEPAPETIACLRYRRHDVGRAIAAMVPAYVAAIEAADAADPNARRVAGPVSAVRAVETG